MLRNIGEKCAGIRMDEGINASASVWRPVISPTRKCMRWPIREAVCLPAKVTVIIDYDSIDIRVGFC